jgi:hypothetical protein
VFLGLTLWQLAVILGVAAYVLVTILVFGIAFRYLCFGMILIGLAASGRAGAKRFLRDWFPLLLFWIGYDALRAIADEIMPRVAVTGPYRLEQLLFGWLAGGEVPAMYFLNALVDSAWRPLVYSVSDAFYWSHFVVIPSYMLFLWWSPRTAARFRMFVCGITVLHLLTLATYILYPAAPPWYVFYFGFQQPSHLLLSAADSVYTPMLFPYIWAANPNRFAAVPSLHGAYPVFLLLLLGSKSRGYWPTALYTVSVWLATVVLGRHYIIDLVLGAFYAWVSVWIVSRYLNRRTATSTSQPGNSTEEKTAV